MCDVLCIIVIIGIIAYVISIITENNKKAAEREQQERRRVEENKKEQDKRVVGAWNTIRQFLKQEQNYNMTKDEELDPTYRFAVEVEGSLVGYYNGNYKSVVSALYDSVKIVQGEQRNIAEHMIRQLEELGKKQDALPDNIMMNSGEYGKANRLYLTSIEKLIQRDKAEEIVKRYQAIIDDVDYDNFININLNELLKAVWFFALEPRFSSEFDSAKKVFCRICKKRKFDIMIADLYVKNKTGGEDAIREPIDKILKLDYEKKLKTRLLTIVASSLMWMKAYSSENIILQYMLSKEMEMTPKMKQRLHDLSKGSKSPKEYLKTSSDEELYFDVSALAWQEDDYIGLFDNFAFQEKVLTYSLAVRDEDKELFVTKEIKIPSLIQVETKLKNIFKQEYGDVVKSQIVNGKGLSGSDEEEMMGILISSEECQQLGVFTYLVKIGKKLNIKFYTLFMPKEQQLDKQRQQALSLYKKLSPSVAMWEASLKETTLLAIQQLLNIESGNSENYSSVVDETIDKDQPVF